ncbi:hypothetical protein [Undibacterium sp. SXout20W]|uniref:hypothetical protein n=1 Tax=Undibacterium sp. SXout20W TaxID=3413051 RepID=UPI003BF05D9C
MTTQSLINECLEAGVSIQLDGINIKLRGAPEAVKSLSNKLRPHKAELLDYLSEGEYTPYVCGITSAHVTELHTLIQRFSTLYNFTEEATQQIIQAAKCQALAAVPESIRYFQNEIQNHSKLRN